jgi:CO/xanthine dehydrogenase FAD-binding subunit
MRRFELAEPRTLEEACGLLSDNSEARAIAGGTALLTLIKHGLFLPKTLVNLKKIKDAPEIDYDSQQGLRIVGAVSPHPVRIDKAEEMARGQRLTLRLMEQIATEASRAVDPVDDLRGPADYKRHLVQVLVPRALSTVAQS